MSFSEANFNKKLESLQETQDSIVSISQWVLFHQRHSKDLANLWANFVLQKAINSQKKLSLLYLCNDVVQQAKHRRKPEFIKAFATTIPRVLKATYCSLDAKIKPKVERLVRVWEERAVFSKEDLELMRKAINESTEVDVEPPKQESVEPVNNNLEIVPELRLLNDLFNNMNKLIDISQANLNHVGIQSKEYLPKDPSVSDNLPAPKIYIEKLNNLERICQISNKNIDDIKNDRLNILNNLNNLKNIMEEGLKTDESKKNIINGKLAVLHKTRNELMEMVSDELKDNEEPEPPSFESNDFNEIDANVISIDESKSDRSEANSGYDDDDDEDDEDDDALPTYDNDSEDEINNTHEAIPTPIPTPVDKPDLKLPASKRFKKSKSKSVAFADNVEVKEYDQENQTEIIKIIKSDDDQTEVDDDEDDNDEEDDDYGLGDEFTTHHKDSVELKHESQQEDEYDPGENDGGSNNSGSSSVLDLLSKLQ